MMDNIKILNVQWICDIGIVTIDNGYEIKTYMKYIDPINATYHGESASVSEVIRLGYKIYPEQLEKILSFYKKGENND